MPWQAAEPGTLAKDTNGAYHIKIGDQWTAAPPGSIAKDPDGGYHINSDALAPPPPPVDAISAANRAAEQSEHGPVQDVIDMVKAIPGGIGKMLTSIGQNAADHPVLGNLPALGTAIQKFASDPGGTLSAIGSAVSHATPQQVGENVVAPMVAGAGVEGLVGKAGALAAGAGEGAAAAEPGAALGYRHAGNSPLARNIAGTSGQEALTLHNQSIGNAALGGEAGLAPGTTPSYEALEEARAPANAVHARVAAALPEGPLTPNAAAQVRAAGGAGQRITQGTPDAQNAIGSLKSDLLDPDRTFTGDQVVNEMRGLRQEGYTNIASDDVSKQQLGRAQLDMSRALETHVAESLPKDADVDLGQLVQARTALAKNYAVQSALRGPNVDLQAIARMQRADPDLLTGAMKDTADFANAHSEVSSLPSAGTRYNPPGLARDLGGFDVLHPVQATAQLIAGSRARAALTGNTGAATAAVPRSGLADALAPIDRGPPQPPPGMTASAPEAPPPAAAGPPGQISLADLLSHGVEQRPAAGLSLAPEGAPAASGVPFKQNAEHMAGDLSLADELAPQAAGQHGDLAGVMSQGVPEGIMARTPQNPGLKMPVAHSPSFINNNASAESPGSLEAVNRNSAEAAAGQTRYMINADGDVTPIPRNADTADLRAPKGSVIVQKGVGSKPFTLIDRGGLPESHANGLVARAFGRGLGDEF